MKNVIVIDDHPLLREGLEALIDLDDGLVCCGSGGSFEEAIELVEQTNPDLVLTDLSLPGRSGIELIKELRVRRPELPVLIVSMHDELIYAERVLRVGGRGYIAKEAGRKVLLDGIHTVLNGGICVSKDVTDSFLRRSGSEANGKVSFPLQRLTKRETEVFELIGKGHDNSAIGSLLHISPRTVDAHRAHIREKLGLNDGDSLTRFAIRWVESNTAFSC